jgi:ketosteroid isomerase-like protein
MSPNNRKFRGTNYAHREIPFICASAGAYARIPPDFLEETMLKRFLTVSICLFVITLSAAAQAKKPAAKKASAGPGPDKAYLQKIWDGWATLDPANTAKFYAAGPRTFFDIAPLKYNGWDEYEKGVKGVLAGYKSAKFTVNDDAAIHPQGDLVWATATVKEEMTNKAGKVEMGNFRWTVVFENQDGKWLIVHEHVSAPLG